MNTPIPVIPYAFTKSTAALTGSGEPIVLPRGHDAMVDWEGEFCAVIGRVAHNVDARHALEYVAGYTLINDVSARDWVEAVFTSTGIMGPIAAWEENLLGKQFPTFCPLGPAIVTADEIPDPSDVRIRTKLNGEIMQDAHTSDLVFGVAELIAYYSQFYALRPGDVISTGSPAGVGFARSPKVFMRPGDIVAVEVDAIGILRNPVRGS
jgi:2-keto-4-pentenoate hydratase/2-oxohepta-3-ene-1,7-dioic acid hydratase in catechol pathway